MNDAAPVLELVPADTDTNTLHDKVIVTLEGQDFQGNLDFFNLTINSSQDEVIGAIAGAVQEERGENIRNTYKIRRSLENRVIYVIPNSVAG